MTFNKTEMKSALIVTATRHQQGHSWVPRIPGSRTPAEAGCPQAGRTLTQTPSEEGRVFSATQSSQATQAPLEYPPTPRPSYPCTHLRKPREPPPTLFRPLPGRRGSRGGDRKCQPTAAGVKEPPARS